MRRFWTLRTTILIAAIFLIANPTVAEKVDLALQWQKTFEKNVSWYVRTSTGILLAKSRKNLTAIDGENGQVLWELPDVFGSEGLYSALSDMPERGRNVLEVPGMGVLLLNRVKQAGHSEGRLLALNLATGARLWDIAAADDLFTAIPLYESGQIVLVSRRLQKKVVAAQLAAAGAGFAVPGAGLAALPFSSPPHRLEFERIDLLTGKIEWNAEYDHIFNRAIAIVKAYGEHLFIQFGTRLVGCIDIRTGKLLWENGARHFELASSEPLPLLMTNEKLIYSSENLQALVPGTGNEAWTVQGLGNITGILVQGGVVAAIGNKMIAAVNAEQGTERWRVKTWGHTTNLIWDKTSDGILYADSKGLHIIDRTSGRPILDAPLNVNSHPSHLRMASTDSVLTISGSETNCFSIRTGKKLFREGKLTGVYRSEAFVDEWPMPEEGQNIERMVPAPEGNSEWEKIRKRTLFTAAQLKRMEDGLSEADGVMDVYQTEIKEEDQKMPVVKIWWADRETNRQMVIHPSAQQHDMSRALGDVYAVNEKILWAAKIKAN